MLEEFKKKRKEKSSICAKNTKKPQKKTCSSHDRHGLPFF